MLVLSHKNKFIKCTNINLTGINAQKQAGIFTQCINRLLRQQELCVPFYPHFFTFLTPSYPSKIEVYRKINFFITSHHKQRFCNTYRNSYSLIATPRKQRVYYPKNSIIENHLYKPHQNGNHNPSILDGFLSRRILLIWFFGL